MPESMRLFLEQKVESGSYGSISEYIRELIRLAQRSEPMSIDTGVPRQANCPEQSRPVRGAIEGTIFRFADLHRS